MSISFRRLHKSALVFTSMALLFACSSGGETPSVDGSGATDPNAAPGTPGSRGANPQSGSCTGSSCVPAPTHDDGAKNGDETGVDCGGPTAPKCTSGGGCAGDGDCDSGKCDGTTCSAPTSTDGIANGTETDVDCGGAAPTNAPTCALGRSCKADADCASSTCNYAGKCVAHPSCKPHHGGDTCGATEDAANHESCCTTIAVPGAPKGAAAIDKYNVTAGRFRAFVEATHGDLRGYITAHPPAWWDASWTSKLPNVLDNGQVTPDDAPAFAGVYQELGPYVHGTAQGANEGCYVKGAGARTFRLPDDVNARMGDEQLYSQDMLDERALNCVTSHMLAAFCAWDGGRLTTRQDLDYLWGSAKYPWGTAAPAGYDEAYAVDPNGTFGRKSYGAFQVGPYVNAPFDLGDVHYANYNYNYWGGAEMAGTDYSIFIAPPGRFPAGNGRFGHADLAGNVFNVTDIVGTGAYWSRSGSWQGHDLPYTPAGSWLNVASTNKYWAMGGRCSRPIE